MLHQPLTRTLTSKQIIMAMWADDHACPWYAEAGKSGLWLNNLIPGQDTYTYCFDLNAVKIHLGY